jgi:hypothetical protein
VTVVISRLEGHSLQGRLLQRTAAVRSSSSISHRATLAVLQYNLNDTIAPLLLQTVLHVPCNKSPLRGWLAVNGRQRLSSLFLLKITMAGLGRRTNYRKSVQDDYLNGVPEPDEDQSVARALGSR